MRNQIHDRFYDEFNTVSTDEQILDIYNQLPSSIKFLAEQWGWNDTEVREDVGKWIRNNYKN